MTRFGTKLWILLPQLRAGVTITQDARLAVRDHLVCDADEQVGHAARGAIVARDCVNHLDRIRGLNNSNLDIRLQAEKRLNRDLSE